MTWINYSERKPEAEPERQVLVTDANGVYQTAWTTIDRQYWDNITHWAEIEMGYEELKREISSRSVTQLPGLLQHVARLCGIKPVFKDKESMLTFVGRAYDMGPAGEAELREESPPSPDPFEQWWATEGIHLLARHSNKDMARFTWDAAIKHAKEKQG